MTETVKSAGDLFAAALVKVGRVENPWFPKVFSNWFCEDFACCATHIDIVEKLDDISKLKVNLEPTQFLGCQLDWDEEVFANPVAEVEKTMASASEVKEFQKRGCFNWKIQTDASSCFTTRKLAKVMLNPHLDG